MRHRPGILFKLIGSHRPLSKRSIRIIDRSTNASVPIFWRGSRKPWPLRNRYSLPTCLAHGRYLHFGTKTLSWKQLTTTSFLPFDRTIMNRKPYAGSAPKLVLAYDVGTTFSGASYWWAQGKLDTNVLLTIMSLSLLEPNEVPVVRGVKRYDLRYFQNGTIAYLQHG